MGSGSHKSGDSSTTFIDHDEVYIFNRLVALAFLVEAVEARLHQGDEKQQERQLPFTPSCGAWELAGFGATPETCEDAGVACGSDMADCGTTPWGYECFCKSNQVQCGCNIADPCANRIGRGQNARRLRETLRHPNWVECGYCDSLDAAGNRNENGSGIGGCHE